MFIEMGPYYFSDRSMTTEYFNLTGIPEMFRNQYSWTTFANVLIINGGGPVAYSYCDPAGPSGNGTTCGNWTDEKTAWVNANYLENFLIEFPNLEKNDWYISGESYAGIYVPTVIRELFNREDSKLKNIIKGFAVGDGCVGTEVLCGGSLGPYFDIKFFGGHGQFEDVLYEEIMDG